MSASSVAFTEWSWMPRLWATAATPTVRQLARPERTSSTGVGAFRKDLRMVCLDRERLVAGLLSTEPEEVADRGPAVRGAQALAACAPLELGRLRSVFQCVARAEQCSHVDAIVHLGDDGIGCGCNHVCVSCAACRFLNWSSISCMGAIWQLARGAASTVRLI